MSRTIIVVDGNPVDGESLTGQVGNLIPIELGETIAAGEVVFIYGSGHANEGEAFKSDADVQDKNRAKGIILTGGNDGDTGTLQTSGIYYETSAFTAGETYYLSATAGAFTTTPSGVKLGIALTTDKLLLDIVQDDRDTISTIKPYLPDHANMIANPLTAFWKLCDGTAISDAESPLNGGDAPDLNDGQFLEGQSTSDDGTDDTAATPTHNHETPFSRKASGTGAGIRLYEDAVWGVGSTDIGAAGRYVTTTADGSFPGKAFLSGPTSSVPKHIAVVYIMKIK